VEDRQRLGDLEIDLMMGKAHKSTLVVITDRATLLTALDKVTTRKAQVIEDCIERRLACIPTSFIKTITVDNDKGLIKFFFLTPILSFNSLK